MVTSYQKEQHLAYVRKQFPELSYSKTCKLLSCCRTNKYYKKVMPQKDLIIENLIRENMKGSRKGRIKISRLIQKEHNGITDSVIKRVYKNCGLSLHKRLKRRVANNAPNPIYVPLIENEEWAMDFTSDVLENGNQIRTLNTVDHYNRKCKSIEVHKSIPSKLVIEITEKTIEKYGKPKGIRTDNGPEFRSKEFQNWLHENHINWVQIEKGAPQQNAIVERFNRTYREDVLDANIFKSIVDAQNITDDWIIDYNEVRPHQSLNYKTPNEYGQ